jgi:hypothetical protein
VQTAAPPRARTVRRRRLAQGRAVARIVFRRPQPGIRRLAEADALAARCAKESGAADPVVTVEPSASTVLSLDEGPLGDARARPQSSGRESDEEVSAMTHRARSHSAAGAGLLALARVEALALCYSDKESS